MLIGSLQRSLFPSCFWLEKWFWIFWGRRFHRWSHFFPTYHVFSQSEI